jgi:hypothetical protein
MHRSIDYYFSLVSRHGLEIHIQAMTLRQIHERRVTTLPLNDADVWLCEYPGPSSPRSPVSACSLVSSLLLVRATMSQDSSLTQSGHSIRQALTACRDH